MKRFCFLLFVGIIFSFLIFSDPVFGAYSVYFNTPSKVVEVGERVTVNVRIRADEQSVNAVSGVFSFPENLLKVVSISKERSVITLWTIEPRVIRNKISFEGLVLNPGYVGDSGLVFQVTFEAKNTGKVSLDFEEGALLANDGYGTNVLASLYSSNFDIIRASLVPSKDIIPDKTPEVQVKYVTIDKKISMLPVITEYPPQILAKEPIYLKGKGEPNALTKIVFKDVAVKSIGERFLEILQTKKKKLDDVLVQNNETGLFEYLSPNDIVAGVYNATPFFVDNNTKTEEPGFGVQLFVKDSQVVKILVIVINVLGLLIPIVLLCVIIYFIPWYSWLKMRVLKKKIGLEEEKIDLFEHQLKRQDSVLDKDIEIEIKNKDNQNTY